MDKKLLKKLAEAPDGIGDEIGDDTKTLAGVLGIGTSLELLKTGLKNIINNNIPQDTPIGSLFADISAQELQKSHPGGSFLHLSSSPRTSPEIMKHFMGGAEPDQLSKIISNFGLSPEAYHGVVLPGNKTSVSDVNMMVDEVKDALRRELTGEAPPDILNRMSPQDFKEGLLDTPTSKKIRSNSLKSLDDINFNTSAINKLKKHLDIEDVSDLIVTPRNNLYSLAHEFGHAVDVREAYKTPIGRKAFNVLDYIGGPLTSSLNENKLLNKIREGIRSKSKVVGGLVDNSLFGMSIPMLATMPLLSDTVRHTAKELTDSESLDNALDWIGENEGLVAGISASPMVLNEMFTNAPGGKLTYDFFNKLKNKSSDIMSHQYGAEVLSKLKNISPNKEVAKFLAHNGILTAGAAIMPLALAAYNYMAGED